MIAKGKRLPPKGKAKASPSAANRNKGIRTAHGKGIRNVVNKKKVTIAGKAAQKKKQKNKNTGSRCELADSSSKPDERYHPHPPNYSRKTANELLSREPVKSAELNGWRKTLNKLIPLRKPPYSKVNKDVYAKATVLMEYLMTGGGNYIKSLDPKANSTVYSGYSGLAYLHIMLRQKTDRAESYGVAKSLIDRSLKQMQRKNISFLMGDSGPLAMAAVVCFMQNDLRKAKGFLAQLNNLGVQVGNNPRNPVRVYNVLNGWAGYLYALLFVNSFIKEAIPRTSIRMCVAKILDDGFKSARTVNSEAPLTFTTDKKNYYGAPQGEAGILYMLLCSGVATSSEVLNHIQPSMNYMISRRLTGGNFPIYDGCTDELVQWCHGAPGFIDLLILCFELFGGPYLQIAEECGNIVWERGLLKKSYSLCHGVAGNAYTFLSLYQKTKKVEQLYRAATYYKWTLNYPENEVVKPEHPFSLFEGQAGILYFLTEMSAPETAAFPCYRLPLSTY